MIILPDVILKAFAFLQEINWEILGIGMPWRVYYLRSDWVFGFLSGCSKNCLRGLRKWDN
jgi:hypothetical protein